MIKEKIKDIFQGDLLTFIADDNKYKLILCTSSYKEKSPQNFTFAVLSYDSVNKPTIDNIFETEFFGVGNSKNDYFKYSTKEFEKMWVIHPEIKPYFLGSYGLIIWRKDFMRFRDNFELVLKLKIVDDLDKNGNGGINASDWTFLTQFFNERFKTFLLEKGQKLFKLKSIIID